MSDLPKAKPAHIQLVGHLGVALIALIIGGCWDGVP